MGNNLPDPSANPILEINDRSADPFPYLIGSIFGDKPDIYLVISCYGMLVLMCLWIVIFIMWTICKDSITTVVMDEQSEWYIRIVRIDIYVRTYVCIHTYICVFFFYKWFSLTRKLE